MGRIEKTVFISYRRTNLPWALAIYQNLTAHGYDVFFDYQSLSGEDVERIVLRNIRARAHFLVILSPSALEQCDNPDDFLRREIETALDERRNIVPLFFEGFNFGGPAITKHLTGKLALLKNYNGLVVAENYFEESMERLRVRFLDIPINVLTNLSPISFTIGKSATGSFSQEYSPKETPSPTEKLKVFLCHSSQDKQIVRDIYKKLISDGFDAWLDEEKLLPGQDWNFEIEKAVEETDAVIVFLSSNSVSKEGYIQRELRFALEIALEKPEGSIFIIPLRLDECELPRRIRTYHYVDLFPVSNTERAYKQILDSLELRAQTLGKGSK